VNTDVASVARPAGPTPLCAGRLLTATSWHFVPPVQEPVPPAIHPHPVSALGERSTDSTSRRSPRTLDSMQSTPRQSSRQANVDNRRRSCAGWHRFLNRCGSATRGGDKRLRSVNTDVASVARPAGPTPLCAGRLLTATSWHFVPPVQEPVPPAARGQSEVAPGPGPSCRASI
jgi:hypothetical protein